MIHKHQKELSEWRDLRIEIDDFYRDLEKILGPVAESKIASLLDITFEDYTRVLGESIGDRQGWLEWYWLENCGGRRGLSAKADSWSEPRRIITLEDLEELIAG